MWNPFGFSAQIPGDFLTVDIMASIDKAVLSRKLSIVLD